jgi:dTDP-4-dehydrorhamnose 3,5-epimerase-like enzyme
MVGQVLDVAVRIRYKSNAYRFLRGLGHGDEGTIYMSPFSMEI